MNWHSGMLYENCFKYGKTVEYLETAYRWYEEDIERINTIIDNYDKVVITNYYSRDMRKFQFLTMYKVLL